MISPASKILFLNASCLCRLATACVLMASALSPASAALQPPAAVDRLAAAGPAGQNHVLRPTGQQRLAQSGPPALRPIPSPVVPAAQPAAPVLAAAKKVKPAETPPLANAEPAKGSPTTQVKPYNGRAADLAGRYAILRENGKDMGCMLTLSEQGRSGGALRAQLAPACRDNGIVVFDPMAWQLERGRLALTARKGHKAMLEHHEDDSWWKDPKEGSRPLGIRKLQQ